MAALLFVAFAGTRARHWFQSFWLGRIDFSFPLACAIASRFGFFRRRAIESHFC